MSKRIKLNAPAIRTRSEAEDVLGQIRELTIERNQRVLEREAAIQAVQESHATRLEQIETQLTQKTELLSGWATAHPEEFAQKKTLDMTHGKIGWRIGMPKLVKRSKATWDSLVEIVSDAIGSGYIRTKKEINREAIINARGMIPPDSLRECGLAITQDEDFFVEPTLEEVENRREA